MTNEELVRNAIEIIWNKGEVSRVRDFYTDDFKAHHSPLGPDWGKGTDGVRDLVTRTRNTFSDYHETIEDLILSGDKVVIRTRAVGTNTGPLPFSPATGKSFKVDVFEIYRINNGKIEEQWALMDHSHYFFSWGY